MLHNSEMLIISVEKKKSTSYPPNFKIRIRVMFKIRARFRVRELRRRLGFGLEMYLGLLSIQFGFI